MQGQTIALHKFGTTLAKGICIDFLDAFLAIEAV